jgi:hypothetical protein
MQMRRWMLAGSLFHLPFLMACGASAPDLEPPDPPSSTPTVAPTVIPTEPAALTRTIGAAYSRGPGQVTLFELDRRTGGLEVKNDWSPDVAPAAPFSYTHTFALHPSGRFLYYGYSCGSVCQNLQGYRIEPGFALTRIQHFGPSPIEAISPLRATRSWLFTHYDDAPIHSLAVAGINRESGQIDTPSRAIGGGYGTASMPFSIHTTPNAVWTYSLRSDHGRHEIVMHRIDPRSAQPLGRTSLELPAPGQSIEIDPQGKFLFLSMQAAPPRLLVYPIDDAGIHGRTSGLETASAGELRVHPSGRFLFLGTRTGVDVYSFDRDTAQLTLHQSSDIGNMGTGPYVEPDGRYLYLVRADTTIWGYTIDPEVGALQDLGKVGAGLSAPPFGTYPPGAPALQFAVQRLEP